MSIPYFDVICNKSFYGVFAIFWLEFPYLWNIAFHDIGTWMSGQSIVGGLLGGLIGVELAKKLTGVNRSTGGDFVMPLMVGTVIGRIGCFLAGLNDGTYGNATTLPWGGISAMALRATQPRSTTCCLSYFGGAPCCGRGKNIWHPLPVCYAECGTHHEKHKPLEDVLKMLDVVVANEGEADVMQISGGEPTLHPQFWEILDAAKARPIKHIMINTNGIVLAQDPEFIRRLATYAPGIEVYLQFDSLRVDVHKVLRGADLTRIRRQALENLNKAGLSTTLVVTLKKGSTTMKSAPSSNLH